ncbi:hypothetical protein TNCV_3259271 [Trichonephila clavipes]|nr:hypothetical protein TNCV_3259271 [Trichonephila clavipes]
MGPPHTNTIAVTAQIESRLVAEDHIVPFRCSPIPSCATPLQMKGSVCRLICSPPRDTRCRSVRRLAMVREDSRTSSEGVLLVSGQRPMREFYTRACRRMLRYLLSTGPNTSSWSNKK